MPAETGGEPPRRPWLWSWEFAAGVVVTLLTIGAIVAIAAR